MKDRGPWRFWRVFLLLATGNLCISVVKCQSYDGGARGDEGSVAALGFSGIEQRHDGYVKGETPTIPQTSFSCSAQPYNPGLYADVETQCQVYHVCFEDRQESFLCGPGTNFNQKILACDFWYNFDCQDSPSFYSVNADIGKVPETVFRPDQQRVHQTGQPGYPRYPQQPDQPPSVGSYPPRVSIPPPPPPPQQPAVPQQPIQPQPPRIHTQTPIAREPAPQPPKIPEPPRVQTLPPRDNPQQPSVQPPAFIPHQRPEPPRVSIQPQYPRVTPSVVQPPKPRPPPPQQLPPSFHQEEQSGYDFDPYKPSIPASLPPPQPAHPQTPRPVFPPVISPPRVSRPPLTPAIIRQPEISRPRVPVIISRPEYHPDANLKGNVDYRPPQQPRVPQPSRPVGTGYPSYPVPQRPIAQRPVAQRPVERPLSRPSYKPPTTPAVQQEHVDTEYVPPPPPPKQPSRPVTSFVPPPPPPPPVQQEVTNVGFTKPPQQPSRPTYLPPPVSQKPVDPDYGKPQPPVAPSVIREQQKPASRPPTRPQVSVSSRQPPQRPKPFFPPPSDHPNANIKGGPGYQQPPPQPPRFEPTRISRPSTPQGGYVPPQTTQQKPVSSGGHDSSAKTAGDKRPSASGSGGYKPPIQGRVKKPSEPPRSIYQPPIQTIDHPRSEIKGSGYEQPVISQQPQRIKSPSTSVSGVKRPQTNGGYQQPQVQRPRAPIVVSRPHPPSLPTTSIKTVDSQAYEKPRPQPPAVSHTGVKQPSQSQIQTSSRPSQPRFPSHQPIDHPNANVKGGPGYRDPQPVSVAHISRPSGPPPSPSTSHIKKTTSPNQGRVTGSGYPSPPTQSHPSRVDDAHIQQQIIQQQEFKPQRRHQSNTIEPSRKVPQVNTGVKDASGYQRPPLSSQHSSIRTKQPKPDYATGSSYTSGPDIYPKPEFGQPSAPYQPISTPSRTSQTTKQGSPSQNTITQAQNKPAYQGSSVSSGSGSSGRPDYPFREVPGHQPPHQRQIFPHRENPDHPNESLKGSGAYRPPPPAGFQASASETQEQKVVPEPEPEPAAKSLLGDIGAE